MATMQGVMSGAVATAAGLVWPEISLDNIDALIPEIIDAPIDFSIGWDILQRLIDSLPDEPTFQDIDPTTIPLTGLNPLPDITDVAIPDFDTPVPAINIKDAPDWIDPGEIPGKPTLNTYSPPSKPGYTMPLEPVLADVPIPTPLPIDIPTFNETLLDEDLLAPSNNFVFNELMYTSALKDAVYNGLLDAITNGGYGLDPNDEQLLFDRERDKESKTAQAGIDEVKKQFASTGYAIPPGAMIAAIQKVTQEMQNKVSSINRDLGLKRADLYWDGKKFSYTTAVELEKVLTTLHNSVQERALNAAKATIQVAIDIFNVQVVRYKAKQERFIALAEVFKAKIQAEMLKVEIFKAQMDGAKLGVDINRSQISLYSERLNAVKTILEAYKTDVDTYRILAEVEKLKMDIFRAEIEAYVAEVQANKARFEAYTASVNGELAKVEIYKAQAQSYAYIVEGKKAQIEAMKTKLMAAVEANKALIEIFRAQIEEQKSIRDAQSDRLKAQTEVYKAEVSAFSSEVDAVSKIYTAEVQGKDLEYRAQIQALTANVEVAKIQLEKVLKQAELLVEIDKAKAELWGRLASSAMSAMNISAGLSESFGNSNTWSHTEQLVSNQDVTGYPVFAG